MTREAMTMHDNAHTTPRSPLRRRLALLATFAVTATALFSSTASPASAATKLTIDTFWAPVYLPAGGSGKVAVQIANGGDTATGGTVATTVQLPAPVTLTKVPASCTGTGTSTLNCTLPALAARTRATMLNLEVSAAAEPGLHQVTTTASTASQPEPTVLVRKMRISDTPLGFGVDPDNIDARAVDASDADYTRAGGHPYEGHASLRFSLQSGSFVLCVTPENVVLPSSCYESGNVADIVAALPPGFVGAPTAVARCSSAQFPNNCPPASQVGYVSIYAPALSSSGPAGQGNVAIYNMVPPPGQPAQFAFFIGWAGVTNINPTVRSDGDYGITFPAEGISEAGIVTRSNVVVWGNPADPVHDVQRCPILDPVSLTCTGTGGVGNPTSVAGPPKAFISLSTNCADDPFTTFHVDSYENRAPLSDLSHPNWLTYKMPNATPTECEKVPFTPSIDFEPTTKQADSPSGLDVNLHIPRQGDFDPDGVVQAHLKKAHVVLPDGVAFNAGAADGLQACSPEQIGLTSAIGATPIRFNNKEPSCPDASKVGTGEVITPVLEDSLTGEVFLASQDENPFDDTFAIYVVVREPSILVKLPGKIELNEQTGQITTTFDENPQLPFEDFNLGFYGGPRGALATPPTCGTFTTHSEFVPWTAEDPDNPKPSEVVNFDDTFSVDSAPNGGGCVTDKAQLPLNAGLNAGSSNPLAGAHSPFEIQITRPDGSQELDRLDISPPPGFVASLKGIPYCSEAQIAATASRESGKAEQANSTCPSASQIGTTNVGAGAGSAPLYTQGKLYLSGPYKGENLSVVAVTPAVAGPFDLGNVVVRSALKINPLTARITAVTDPLPRTIEGVPLRIRDVRIALDRPNWALNPTNCEAMSVDVTAYGVGGAVSKPTNRYQVGGCERLGFKPRLSLVLKGGTKRGDHPALLATLKTRPGDANIARAAVTLPSSAFLDQAHIRTICTRVQYAADSCPKGAIYGYAKATTPLLDDPIQGEVILRSSDNKLPDLVGRLRGVANIEAVGRIDSVKGGIRNTFDVIPDAPFDVFTLSMQGGNKGLVINSKNLCAKANRATAKFTAQNGRTYNYRPVVVAEGCGKAKKAKRGKRGGQGGR